VFGERPTAISTPHPCEPVADDRAAREAPLGRVQWQKFNRCAADTSTGQEAGRALDRGGGHVFCRGLVAEPHARELCAGGNSELHEDIAEVVVNVRLERNIWAAISLFSRPSAAYRAICCSCGVSSAERARIALARRLPGSRSSPRARSAHGSAVRRSKASNSARRCVAGAPFAAQVLALEQPDASEVERPRVGAEEEGFLEVLRRLVALGEERSATCEPRPCPGRPHNFPGAALRRRQGTLNRRFGRARGLRR
jgi:hypothetical protein